MEECLRYHQLFVRWLFLLFLNFSVDFLFIFFYLLKFIWTGNTFFVLTFWLFIMPGPTFVCFVSFEKDQPNDLAWWSLFLVVRQQNEKRKPLTFQLIRKNAWNLIRPTHTSRSNFVYHAIASPKLFWLLHLFCVWVKLLTFPDFIRLYQTSWKSLETPESFFLFFSPFTFFQTEID